MTSLERTEQRQRKKVDAVLKKIKLVESEKTRLVKKLVEDQSEQTKSALRAALELERSLLSDYALEAKTLLNIRSELGVSVNKN